MFEQKKSTFPGTCTVVVFDPTTGRPYSNDAGADWDTCKDCLRLVPSNFSGMESSWGTVVQTNFKLRAKAYGDQTEHTMFGRSFTKDKS